MVRRHGTIIGQTRPSRLTDQSREREIPRRDDGYCHDDWKNECDRMYLPYASQNLYTEVHGYCALTLGVLNLTVGTRLRARNVR